MDKLQKVVELVDEFQSLSIERSKLGWTQYTVGYDFGIEENYKKTMDFLKDKEKYNIIKAHAELELNSVDRRRLDLVLKMIEPYHKSDEINRLDYKIQMKRNKLSKLLNTFRFKLDNKEVTSVELTRILTTSEDRQKRKEAYLAKNQINKPMIDAGFLELVEMRKELATLSGYDNFISYKLDKEDLDVSIFDDWKEQVNELLPDMNKMRMEYAIKYLGDENMMPWDEAYVESKIAPSLSHSVDMSKYYEHIAKLFKKFGFEINDYNITYDIFPRANKSEWGYNFTIETGVDSRILANVQDKYYQYGVLLHETGHAVHSFLKDPDEKLLNIGINGIITEGIANLFGSFMYDEEFYNEFFGDDAEKVKLEFIKIKKWKKMNALRTVSRILFDQEFYRRSNISLEDVYDMYWDLNKEILGTIRADYEPPWAFLIHHTTHPIYYHNYFMGDVTCEMLINIFNEKNGTSKVSEKPLEFGKFLYEEVIKPSGRYTYTELFSRISGEKFSLRFLK